MEAVIQALSAMTVSQRVYCLRPQHTLHCPQRLHFVEKTVGWVIDVSENRTFEKYYFLNNESDTSYTLTFNFLLGTSLTSLPYRKLKTCLF